MARTAYTCTKPLRLFALDGVCNGGPGAVSSSTRRPSQFCGPIALRAAANAASMPHEMPTLAACLTVGIRAAYTARRDAFYLLITVGVAGSSRVADRDTGDIIL